MMAAETRHADEDDEDFTAVASRAAVTAALAKRAKPQRPWLVVVTGSGSIGKTYRLENQLVLGRAPRCDVQIDEDGVSRSHAHLLLTPERTVQIVDMDSRNGTFVNGERVTRETLRDGDKIQIGDTTILKFSYQDDLDEALQRNLYESATQDPLTRAANRRSFSAGLAKEFAFAARHKRPLSIIVFDIDHFKRINDSHGHPAGDHVLKRLAETVAASVRAEDLFARLGGEEFAVLLRDIASAGAFDCAQRIRGSIEQTVFEHSGTRIPVTISAGVATLGSDADFTPEMLVAAADRKLYDAKQTGRNRVCA